MYLIQTKFIYHIKSAMFLSEYIVITRLTTKTERKYSWSNGHDIAKPHTSIVT